MIKEHHRHQQQLQQQQRQQHAQQQQNDITEQRSNNNNAHRLNRSQSHNGLSELDNNNRNRRSSSEHRDISNNDTNHNSNENQMRRSSSENRDLMRSNDIDEEDPIYDDNGSAISNIPHSSQMTSVDSRVGSQKRYSRFEMKSNELSSRQDYVKILSRFEEPVVGLVHYLYNYQEIHSRIINPMALHLLCAGVKSSLVFFLLCKYNETQIYVVFLFYFILFAQC